MADRRGFWTRPLSKDQRYSPNVLPCRRCRVEPFLFADSGRGRARRRSPFPGGVDLGLRAGLGRPYARARVSQVAEMGSDGKGLDEHCRMRRRLATVEGWTRLRFPQALMSRSSGARGRPSELRPATFRSNLGSHTIFSRLRWCWRVSRACWRVSLACFEAGVSDIWSTEANFSGVAG